MARNEMDNLSFLAPLDDRMVFSTPILRNSFKAPNYLDVNASNRLDMRQN